MDYSIFNLYLIGGFFLINLVIGLWAGRNVTTIKDYILADKKFGVGALVITYLATEVGDDTVFRSPFEFFSCGISYLLVPIGCIISFFLRAYLIAPLMHRFKDCMTLSDMMQQLYGSNAKIFTGLISCIYSLIVTGFQICCMGVIFEKFLGMDSKMGMIFSGVILVIYSAFGGIKAVTATDIFQFIMAVGTLLLISAVAVNKVGGIEVLFSKIPSERFEFFKASRLPYYLSFFIMTGAFFIEICEPCRMQRVLMSNNTRHLKKTFFALGLAEIIITFIVLILSFSAVVLCPNSNPNEVIPTLCHTILPNSIQGVLAVGFLAIFLSTGDSYLHSAGINLSYDFISPILARFKKEINEVKWAKISTIFIGILSILFALFEGYTIRLDYIFASLGLFICCPLLFGIFGFVSQPSTYFGSCFVSLLAFIACKFTNPLVQEFTMPISMSIGAATFLILHFISNKKFVIVKNSTTNKSSLRLDINTLIEGAKKRISSLVHFNTFCKERVEKNGSSYSLFGTMYTVILVLPYFLWSNEVYKDQEHTILYLRIIGVVMCSILMAESRIPQILARYTPVFWYITLVYCLPFLSVVTLFITNGSMEYVVNIALTIMFLIVLVDLSSAIGISIIGTIAAILFYKFFIKKEEIDSPFSFSTVYLLVYQIIFGTIIGLLFARRKQVKVKELEKGRESAAKLYELAEAKLNDKEFGPLRIARSLGNSNLNILGKLRNIRESIKSKDPEIAEEHIDILESDILTVIINEEKCLKLEAKEIDIKELADYLEALCKNKVGENIYVNLKTKTANIICDKMALSRIISQAIEEIKIDLSLHGRTLSNTSLLIDISDTKLHYYLTSIKEYSKTINAVKFAISTIDPIDTSLLKEEYSTELPDLFGVKPNNQDTTEKIATEKYLTAHCGICENIKTGEELIKIYTIPQNVYEIRPKGLDIYKIGKNVVSFWREATDKELLLKQEIEYKSPNIDWASVQKALDFTRKYHDQKHLNSYGEPHHLHTIAVARIMLEIMSTYIEELKYPANINGVENPLVQVYYELRTRQEAIIIATILHNVLEDAASNPRIIESIFGYEVAVYVLGTTRISYSEIAHNFTNEQILKSLLVQDPIPCCIKIADRLYKLYTIDGNSNEDNRRKVAQETLDFFITPAKNLGFISIAKDLENASNYILKHGRIGRFKFESGVLDLLEKRY
jgi:Na+/proline symporter